jgi:hypothetical protein
VLLSESAVRLYKYAIAVAASAAAPPKLPSGVSKKPEECRGREALGAGRSPRALEWRIRPGRNKVERILKYVFDDCHRVGQYSRVPSSRAAAHTKPRPATFFLCPAKPVYAPAHMQYARAYFAIIERIVARGCLPPPAGPRVQARAHSATGLKSQRDMERYVTK